MLTKSNVIKKFSEIVPLVEELSEQKCNLVGHKIKILKEYFAIASYNPAEKEFCLDRKIGEHGEEYFERVIGHEIFHNAQHSSNKGLMKRAAKLEYDSWIKKIFSKKKEPNSLIKLIEGDATIVEFLVGSKLNHKFPYPICSPKRYLEWSNKIIKNFKSRREINELYTAPIKELDKIFL